VKARPRDDLREAVRSAVDLVDLVSAHGVTLTRAGTEMRGLCPFHPERTPSFYVSPAKKVWTCRGACGRGGDVFTFVQLAAGVDYPNALEQLARRAGIPQGGNGTRPRRMLVQPRSAAEAPEESRRLPAADVGALWAAARPVSTSPEGSAWLARRKLDAARVEDEDLCRVLPENMDLPRWAWRWREGWRVLFPMYDVHGHLVSLRARWTPASDPPNGKKSLAPAGASIKGTLLADGAGRELLRTRYPARVVFVCEGEVDMSAAALSFGESREHAAVLGIVGSGCWNAAIAARIRSTTARVVLALDDDAKGWKYAEEIGATLEGVPLTRWTPNDDEGVIE
jgi:hypothetical protein